MFVHHIAYRYENGSIEGFVGSGLTPSSAHQNSVYSAKAAVTTLRREAFTTARIIGDLKSLSREERIVVESRISARTYRAALL